MEKTRKRSTVPRLRGLPSSRSGALLLSAVCALAAAAVIIYAISQYRKTVQTSSRQDTVLVATGLIQKGTSGTVIGAKQLVRPMPVLEKHLQPGSITNATMLNGKVALHDLVAGEQLRFSDFGYSTGYASQLAPNERAISVPLDASHGLASVIHAGDHVDVYAGVKGNASGSASGSSPSVPGTASASSSTSVALRLLLSNVTVVAVGLNGGGNGGVGGGGGSTGAQSDVLLKVGAADAGAVALASDLGNIWLVLRGANALNPTSQNGLDFTFSAVFHNNQIGAHP